MNLVWKLLRSHISIPQFAGFFLANLCGMFIVLLGIQFYRDIAPVFTSADSFMGENYIIVSKRVGTTSTISGSNNAFSQADVDELSAQDFISGVGRFVSANYKVNARMGIGGQTLLNSEIFFESVPDDFIDLRSQDWHFRPGDRVLPVILPRSYIAMYNFGFARQRSLPRISEGLAGMVDLRLYIQGNGHNDEYQGRVIGFSSRINTILVPQQFMDWSNKTYSTEAPENPTRLILRVKNPTDERIAQYMDDNGLEAEDNDLSAEKATYFLKMVSALVLLIGLVIALLSFYILMLSIFLLVQKNQEKLQNLLLIGYSPRQVALPYQLLTIGLNAVVLLLAVTLLVVVRGEYMAVVETLFPQIGEGSIAVAVGVGLAMLLLVSAFNMLVIRRKVTNL